MNKAKGRMFKSVGWTWNPVVGCNHNCPYECWAKTIRSKQGKDFTKPTLNERELLKPMPGDGSWIFVVSMGDLFCSAVPTEMINKVLERISWDDAANNRFLLQTKNPRRFSQFDGKLIPLRDMGRIILGTTIETNRAIPGGAPPTVERYEAMAEMHSRGFQTFLSLEPLADFDLDKMLYWIQQIQPWHIEMGLENYSRVLDVPPLDKVKKLYLKLSSLGYEVLLKENLEWRILGGQ
jgi:DNA repair photolyase